MNEDVKVDKILICGNIAGCGKTTAAKYLTDKYGFKEFIFAEGVYEIARKYFGMKGKDRQKLIDIGQKMREIDPYVWINHCYKSADEVELKVVSDCRQENEYKEGVKRGYLPIRIICNRNEAIERIHKRDGKCDVSLLDTEGEIGTRHIPMINIDNNGNLEDMFVQLDHVVKHDFDEYVKNLATAEEFA